MIYIPPFLKIRMSISKEKRKDEWILDTIFDQLQFKTPDGTNFRWTQEEFANILAETGLFEEIYIEEFEEILRDGRTEKIDYFTESKWGKMISDPRVAISKSKQGKEFRRKFRVPYPVFAKVIVSECERLNVFEVKDYTRVRVPTEIKVLCCLRILARGAYQDDIAEMANCFRSSVHTFFRQFLKNFTPSFYEQYVTPPKGAKLEKVMATYAKMGLMGAMGSMDVTHVMWGKCPSDLHSSCTGKEKKPSVAFQCVVDPSNLIHSVSNLIHGAECDQQICRNDPYTKKLLKVFSAM